MTSWCVRGALRIAFIDISILEWQEQAKLYLKASGNTILKRSVTTGKKNCQHILFTPPQHRSKIPVWIISNANTQPHKPLCFLKCFSKHKCVFSIKKIQLHERKSWLLSLHSTQNKCQFSCYSWKKSGEAMLCLGSRKQAYFLMFTLNPSITFENEAKEVNVELCLFPSTLWDREIMTCGQVSAWKATVLCTMLNHYGYAP